LPLAKADKLPDDVALEAFNLSAAFIDADGRHTDEELSAFIAVFAARFDTVARAGSPPALRAAGLLAGKRTFLDTPSPLFDVLVQADRRSGTAHSWRYYLASVEIAHAVFALDDHPSHAELTAVERFRSMLLRAIDTAGVPRPGGPERPSERDGGPEVAPRPAGVGDQAAEPEEPLEPARPLEELLAELDGLVGLAPVKAEVKLVTNLLRIEKLRTERGLKVVEHSRHLVFTGNPGTGKTTVARLLAQIYRTLGVVEKGQLVETDRSGLVAGYIGQTSIKVKEVFTKALGGVLLIDEAHALARGEDRDFGHEAIDMIVKLMEDHRDDVVLIVAGYPDEMATFLDANPGLRSRFPKTIYFDDYSNEELLRIFEGMCAKSHYTPTDDAKAKVLAYVAARPRDRGFGNARLVRNLFEAAVSAQASRVVELGDVSDAVLVGLEAADIPSP
ncbi:MAG TPA: AAA family ATPase, partial [Acidimicrobiales bacterium]|nr:AAA family ATPase [Acidimicrobiales bacterium]